MNFKITSLIKGLRGAMAFALAYRNTSTDNRQIMATTTSMIVIVTVLFNGGLTSWFTEYLGIRSFHFCFRRWSWVEFKWVIWKERLCCGNFDCLLLYFSRDLSYKNYCFRHGVDARDESQLQLNLVSVSLFFSVEVQNFLWRSMKISNAVFTN